MPTEEGASPLDIISEARRDVPSASEELSGSSVRKGGEEPSYAGIARTREEHLKRATGSFSSLGSTDSEPHTNNPRVLKARAAARKAQAEAKAAQIMAAEAAEEQAEPPRVLDPVVAFAQGSVEAVSGVSVAAAERKAAARAAASSPSQPLGSPAATPAPAADGSRRAFSDGEARPASSSAGLRDVDSSAKAAGPAFAAAATRKAPASARSSIDEARDVPAASSRGDAASPADDALIAASLEASSSRPSAANAKSSRPRVRDRRRVKRSDLGSSEAPLDSPAELPVEERDGEDAGKRRFSRKERDAVASRRVGKAPFVALGFAFALAVALIAGFAGHRWGLYDDALDFQGTWYIAGTDVPIEITADTIVLNDEVSYRYELDESAKTIVFTFSYLEGEGHYRFSLDRSQLAIMDGVYGWWDTLGEDLAWMPGALVGAIEGQSVSPAGAGGVTLLSRTSSSEQQAAAQTAPDGSSAADAQSPADQGSLDAAARQGADGQGAGGPSGASEA